MIFEVVFDVRGSMHPFNIVSFWMSVGRKVRL